ncbi:MAG: metallophosphoesterase [Acetatifactor sp.]|nr:metallophosphoesterase [Acetatifactor sp.]
MKYYISDLHLFHEACIRFDNRPFATVEEMNETILNNWNNKVNNGDTVYILGDVSMRGQQEELIALVAKLKGHKILIKGNHDDLSDYRYQQLFSEIVDYKEVTDHVGQDAYQLVLMHYPIFSFKRMRSKGVLLYGHTHDSAEDTYFQKCIHEMNQNDCRHAGDGDIKAYNVGCMKPYMDYTPRTLAEIMEGAEVGRSICPKCGSKQVIPLLYGRPAAHILEEAEKGNIKLGGCMIEEVEGGVPNRYCKECEHKWKRE